MMTNSRFEAWRKALENEGIFLSLVWRAKTHYSMKCDDVFYYLLHGNVDFRKESCVIVKIYPDSDEFEVFYQSKFNKFEDEALYLSGKK